MMAQEKAEENRIKEEDSIRKAETALNVALIQADSKDAGSEMGADTTEDNGMQDQIDLMKLSLEKEKQRVDTMYREKELNEVIRSTKVAEQQKEKEIAIKRKIANKPTPKPVSKK
jgi:hypothetical protein